MLLTRKIACPSCNVGLKIAEALAEGKAIECPKCGVTFRVPGANGRAESAVPARPRKAAPPPDEEDDAEHESPPPRRKKKKFRKKKQASKAPLIIGLVAGVVLLLGAGAAVAFVWKPWQKKTDTIADNGSQKVASGGGSGAGDSDQRAERGPAGGSGAESRGRGGSSGDDSQRPRSGGGAPVGAGDSRQTGGGSDQFAAAKSLFETNCARCHTLGGSGGGRRGRGPNLSTIGRDPSHSADWLAKFISNPKSVKPDSGMPSFGNKLEAADIRALADYLASLK